ncbi:MAG TPA: HAD family hydrolase [bacterium]|nr:HAD family hydrolase [bacterium]
MGAAVMFQGVLFDLDGTLLDTLADLAEAANAALADAGCPGHERDAYRYFVGDGVQTLAQRILPADKRGPEYVTAVAAGFTRHYAKNWAAQTQPYDGIPELLDYLTARNLRLGVLSNKPAAFTRQLVEHYFSRSPFLAVLGVDEQHPPKPDPGGAQLAAQALAVSPAEILYLGDTGTDMKTAVAAGMYPVGALWGFRERDELLRDGARVLVEHPRAVAMLVNG